MKTVLLVVLFLAYIGLGIPDSLFGSVWPAIYADFGIPVSYAGFITTLVSCGTILSSLLSAPLIKKFGTDKVAAVSTALTALALLGFSVSGNLAFMCLFAVPLGLGAGSIDVGLNNYVAVHYEATHMSFLHCFYGVGVTVSPFLMSYFLRSAGGWRSGYRTIFLIQLAITAVMFLSLPMWKKVEAHEEEEVPMELLSIRQCLRIPAAKAALAVFFGSCAIESITLGWGSTFLTHRFLVTPATAAGIITFYYVGMTLGRLLSGLAAKKLSAEKIIIIGEIVTAAAVCILLASSSAAVAGLGLFLVGLGNGPVFPNMTHLTPIHFGKAVSQSLISLQMSVSYISFLTVPVLFGLVAQRWSAGLLPWGLLILFAITAYSIFFTLNYHAKKVRKG